MRASRISLGVIAKIWRIVSLNWRMLEKPAANATSRERQLGRLDQHAGALGALRTSERDRARADLGGQLPVQVPLAVAEPLAEFGDASAVDDAVGDQAHRAPDQIGSRVPLR